MSKDVEILSESEATLIRIDLQYHKNLRPWKITDLILLYYVLTVKRAVKR